MMSGDAAAHKSSGGEAEALAAADLSQADQSHISAAEVSQMAQTMGADFLGSAILESEKAGDAEGADGREKRPGVSFEEVASGTGASGAVDVKGLSTTGASLGETSATALSMADTKARTQAIVPAAVDAGDTQAFLGGTLGEGGAVAATAITAMSTLQPGVLDSTVEGQEEEEGEMVEGDLQGGALPAPASPSTRPGTHHTLPTTSKTEDTTQTEQSVNLAGEASDVVVRSLLDPAGGKGRQKYLGCLIPLAKLDDATIYAMALQMNLPDLPSPPAVADEEEGVAPGALDPEDREELVDAIAEDERGRHALCIQLQVCVYACVCVRACECARACVRVYVCLCICVPASLSLPLSAVDSFSCRRWRGEYRRAPGSQTRSPSCGRTKRWKRWRLPSRCVCACVCACVL